MLLSDTAAQLRLTITHHHNLYVPTQWTDEQTTWGGFVAQVQAAGHRRDTIKESAPLISLYQLRAGGKRCKADVLAMYGLCLDFDHKALDDVMIAVERFQSEGIAVLAYTTWRHMPPEHEHWRLIVPFARPLPTQDFDGVLAYAWAHFAEAADRDADGYARGFFVPSVHPDRYDWASIYYFEGSGWEPQISRAPAEVAPTRPQAQAPTPAAVRVVAGDTWGLLFARWKRGRNPKMIDLAARGEAIMQGIGFAVPGERDTILWDLLSQFTLAYPDVSADAVWAFMRSSVERMAQDAPQDCITEHDVREKLERARTKALDAIDASMPYDRRAAIRQAFGGTRELPYTADELANIQEVTGLTPETLEHSWVLQHETDYYLVGLGGKLTTCNKEAFVNTARVVLAPSPIEMYIVAKEGRRLKTQAELLEAHSLPLTEVRRSLVADRVKFDLPRRSITIPACPKRPLAAKYNPDIDNWLTLLAGPRYIDLTKWLAHVPDLSHPLTGLVLTGPKSVGKSMLAMGLSRLWCLTGPSKLSEAMGNYNAALERCPFCHADEADIPKDSRGIERTGELREFIQCTARSINEKYRRAVPLDGAARLQISANNENVFALHADLTDHDLDAIAERFTHVRCNPAAGEFLHARGGREGLTEWVEGDALPAHVLWLAEQHGHMWEGRFGVEQTAIGLADTLAVRGGVRSRICELCIRVLSGSEPLGEGAFVLGKELIVHLDWVLKLWGLVLGKNKPPTSAVIQALEGLGERVEADGQVYFALESKRLEAWAFESGYGTKERVHEWLKRHALESEK